MQIYYLIVSYNASIEQKCICIQPSDIVVLSETFITKYIKSLNIPECCDLASLILDQNRTVSNRDAYL